MLLVEPVGVDIFAAGAAMTISARQLVSSADGPARIDRQPERPQHEKVHLCRKVIEEPHGTMRNDLVVRFVITANLGKVSRGVTKI